MRILLLLLQYIIKTSHIRTLKLVLQSCTMGIWLLHGCKFEYTFVGQELSLAWSQILEVCCHSKWCMQTMEDMFLICSWSSSASVPVMGNVMVKMDPPKLVPPGTNFSINKDPPELILLQNMDSLWKIWTTSHRWKNTDPYLQNLNHWRTYEVSENYSSLSV